MATVPGLTIDDFERLPEALAYNHELVDGELVAVSGNNLQHNLLRGELESLLREHVNQCRLGVVVAEQEFDFGGNAHAPDISFFGESKQALRDLKLRVQRFVPDLAIEIVSANDTFETLIKKAQRYRRSGTREVWILSLETRQALLPSDKRRVMLDENEEFCPETIPGFAIRIGDLLDRCS